MAYLEVPDSDLDADSPLTETLMIQINDNIKSLKAAEVTGGNSHDHSGGDGDPIPTGGIADGAVTRAKLARIWSNIALTGYGSSDNMNNTSDGAGGVSVVVDTSHAWSFHDTGALNGNYSYYPNINEARPDHNVKFKAIVKTDSDINNTRYWVGFTDESTTIRADGTPNANISIFRYDTVEDGTAFWSCVTCDGTWSDGSEVTVTIQSIEVDTEYTLEIDMTDTEHIFRINGAVVGTHNTAGKVPTATTTLDLYAGNTTLSNTARGLYVHSVEWYRES